MGTPHGSEALRVRARRRLPGGVNSNVRMDAPSVFFARAEGAWLHDVDGNDYVDHLLGQGPAFLGHAQPDVTEAVARATRDGMVYGGQHELEVVAAERICDALGWAEMVRLGMTGSESVHGALRLARGATGRMKFIRFEGAYHGWLDEVLALPQPGPSRPASGGQPDDALARAITLPWNDLDVVRATLEREGDDVAAIITEPVMCNAGVVSPEPGYLAGLRALADEFGVVLIFDEVITGFRLALGGAAEHFGVVPDLAVYGKAIAGTWPVAALAGTAELMERIGRREVNHAGTFNSNVMAAAAVVSTIDRLREDPPYERIRAHAEALMEGLRALAEEAGIPLRVEGPGPAFHAGVVPAGADPRDYPVRNLTDVLTLDADRYRAVAAALCANGVWVAGRGIWFVSAAHGERELDVALERAKVAFGSL